MKLKLLICSENNTLLEEIEIEPHYPKDRPEDANNLTEVRFASDIIEYLSMRFNCGTDV